MVQPRQIAMYLSRELTGSSLQKLDLTLVETIQPFFMPMKKSA